MQRSMMGGENEEEGHAGTHTANGYVCTGWPTEILRQVPARHVRHGGDVLERRCCGPRRRAAERPPRALGHGGDRPLVRARHGGRRGGRRRAQDLRALARRRGASGGARRHRRRQAQGPPPSVHAQGGAGVHPGHARPHDAALRRAHGRGVALERRARRQARLALHQVRH